MDESLNLFWPPCVVVAPPIVVVRRQIHRDLETVFEIFVQFWNPLPRNNDRCHFFLPLKVTVGFQNFRNARILPKCTFLCWFINLFVFSLFTQKHTLKIQYSSRNSPIQVIEDALSAYLRTYHLPTPMFKFLDTFNWSIMSAL